MSEKDKPKYKTKVTKLEVDSKEAIDLLVKQVNELKTKLKLISSLQQAIVEYQISRLQSYCGSISYATSNV